MLESQSASKTKPLIPKEYPLELLKALVAGTSLDPPPKITNDILAGMQYALFTLPADQQKLLHLRYIRRLTVLEAAAQLSLPEEEVRCLEKKALASLRFPVKWSYIRHGIAGYMRKRIAQEHRLAYRNGYCDGYRTGAADVQSGIALPDSPDAVPDLPIETLDLSPRAVNCLKCAQISRIHQLISLSERQILCIRHMGTILANEIATALQAQGILHTAWDKFVL